MAKVASRAKALHLLTAVEVKNARRTHQVFVDLCRGGEVVHKRRKRFVNEMPTRRRLE